MKFSIKATAIGAIAAALAIAIPTTANAATSNVTGTINGGSLSLTTSATPTFTDNLSGGDQTQTYTVPMTASDLTGSGSGWKLTIAGTQFSTGGGTPSTLATNASSLTGTTSACDGSGSCVNPTNAITYPLTVPTGTAVSFFNAAANTGMGGFTVTPTIGVYIPRTSKAGTYTSTLTLTIATGP